MMGVNAMNDDLILILDSQEDITLTDDGNDDLLLVDDVVTTGATIIACAQELAKAEGVRISVLSVGFTKD